MILLALGANLSGLFGTSEEMLRACVPAFSAAGFPVIKASSIWESDPVPVSDQPLYKNAVCAVEASLSALELLQAIRQIEHEFGRARTVRNAARVIDIDILAYGKMIYHDENLELPHPRLHERSFVLYPLQEIASDWVHPALHLSVKAMMDGLPDDHNIRRVGYL